jgi:hypothetical protein
LRPQENRYIRATARQTSAKTRRREKAFPFSYAHSISKKRRKINRFSHLTAPKPPIFRQIPPNSAPNPLNRRKFF